MNGNQKQSVEASGTDVTARQHQNVSEEVEGLMFCGCPSCGCPTSLLTDDRLFTRRVDCPECGAVFKWSRAGVSIGWRCVDGRDQIVGDVHTETMWELITLRHRLRDIETTLSYLTEDE